jgi:hypothetical protein
MLTKPTIPARTHDESQHALTRTLPCLRQHEMHLNTSCPKPSMPTMTQNVSHHLLTKPSPASEDVKFISTCVDQTNRMPASTQNVYQHVLTKQLIPARTQYASLHALSLLLQCQRTYKMHINLN